MNRVSKVYTNQGEIPILFTVPIMEDYNPRGWFSVPIVKEQKHFYLEEYEEEIPGIYIAHYEEVE